MSWYNSLSDLTGDIKSIAQGKNPANTNTASQYVSSPGIGLTNPSTLPVAPGTGQKTSGDLINGDSPPDGSTPTDPSGGNWWDPIISGLEAVGGDVLAFAKKYGTTALEAASIIQSARQQAQANEYANTALNGNPKTGEAGAIATYNAKAPLRTAGQAGMLNPGANTPDLSNIRTLATSGSGNPFAKALPVAGVATKAPGYDSTGNLNPVLPIAGNPQASPPPSHPIANGPVSPTPVMQGGGPTLTPLPPVTSVLGGTGTNQTPAKVLPVAPTAPPALIQPRLTLPVAGAMT